MREERRRKPIDVAKYPANKNMPLFIVVLKHEIKSYHSASQPGFSGTALGVLYMYIEYVFYSLKHNDSFILYLKLHKILAISFGVLPSSDPSEN